MTDRKTVLHGITDTEEKMFLSHICDMCDKSEKTGRVMYSKFMSPRQELLIKERLAPLYDIRFFGGFDGAQRVMAAVVPSDWEEPEFPMCAVRADNLGKRELTHRDYLGSILALGITRENIGDIAVADDGAYIFMCADIAEYIMTNLTKVASSGIRLTREDDFSKVEVTVSFKIISATVSSMRLDCIISAATGKSRSVSASVITDGLVSVNYSPVKNVSYMVKDKDVLSVRGFGKAVVETDMTLTKKGRTHINIKKYV